MPSTTIPLTVGDTGVTIKGTITQESLGDLPDLTGCSVKFSLLQTSGGPPVVDEVAATLGTLDQANNSVTVSYRLQAADVAKPTGLLAVRWTFILPDGGEIHAPAAGKDNQTFVQISN